MQDTAAWQMFVSVNQDRFLIRQSLSLENPGFDRRHLKAHVWMIINWLLALLDRMMR